jgi:catechol 2,3-dioxygenase-like lactoylglutathione lyase family enzyme
VFWGPDGVPLLFMVGHKHTDQELRASLPADIYSEVATVSVITDSIPVTRHFYQEILGLSVVSDHETAPDFLERANKLTGVPSGTGIHWILYAAKGEPSGKILVLQFGGGHGKRLTGRMKPGNLGFSLLSHRVSNLDALSTRLNSTDYRLVTPLTEVVRGDRTERVLIAIGPNEEMFEFVGA